MPDRIDYDAMTQMLSAVVVRIRNARDTLASLDAATGDGDHGAAMCKVADAIARCLEAHQGGGIHSLLSEISWAVMGTDAGSTGPLYGTWFLGLSDYCVDRDVLDAADLAAMLEHGLTNLAAATKAQKGDKTMIDALVPAVEAARKAANRSVSVEEALAASAQAAENGADETRNMQAAFGRARNIGERSIGHVDPGAASMALVFAGLKEGFANG